MASLEFTPPILRNFADESEEGFFVTKMAEWEAKHMGKFVLAGLENSVRVWALANAWTHNQVIDDCGVKGRILGGGSISVDELGNPAKVYSYSGDYGGLPDQLMQEYFIANGYSVGVEMTKNAVESESIEWLRAHGIDI